VPIVHIHRAKARWKDRFRAYKIVDRFRAYNIVVDGNESADVRNGESTSLELSPGQHEIHAQSDWTASNAVLVTLAEGDAVHLGVANDINLLEFTTGPAGIAQVLVAEKDSYLKLGFIDPPASS
jgi:hypothetical protein